MIILILLFLIICLFDTTTTTGGAFYRQSKPIELNRSLWFQILPNITSYWYTDKIDGKKVTISSGEFGIEHNFIADAEQYKGKYYLFDCHCSGDFSHRLKELERIAKLDKSFVLKTFTKITNENIRHISEQRNKKIETDGLIFIQDSKPYNDTKTYKWKPPEKSTIDFLLRRASKNTYTMFVAIDKRMAHNLRLQFIGDQQYGLSIFNPTLYNKMENPSEIIIDDDTLDNKVVEVAIRENKAIEKNNTKYTWIPYRIRHDKTDEYIKSGKPTANNHLVADNIYTNFFNPLSLDLIRNPTTEGYFQIYDNPIYKEQRSYLNFAKKQLISQIDTSVVVDLGSGKGQDLHKYESNLNIKTLICIDKDMNALSELISRRYSLRRPLHVVVIQWDLTNINGLRDVINKLSKTSKHFVANFAIHYLGDDVASLCKGSHVWVTCFDKKTITRALQKGPYNKKENGKIKYHIEWATKNKSIKVLLPFSKELYEETLWTPQWKIIDSGPMTDWLSEWDRKLSSMDQEWCSFYHWYKGKA